MDQLIFRNTASKPGRNIIVSPSTSAMKHLAYARIILRSPQLTASFSTGDRETGLICLSGGAAVWADSKEFALGQYDSLYVPRDSSVRVVAQDAADIAEFSAEVSRAYPPQVVRYSHVESDPSLKLNAGTANCKRQVNLLLAKNIQAGRLIAGFTDSDPGNWTSWPPHEHADMLEELYVYFNMPSPAYGIQLVYSDGPNASETALIVREGDVVLLPAGYHPNVAVPGHRICFLWAMAAHREIEDRKFGVVNVQPGFSPPPPANAAARR